PQMVMAMASPAGRLENSSIPSHAVPARVSPTQTPQARNPNMDTTSMVMTNTSFMMDFALLLGQAFQAPNGFVDNGDKKDGRPNRHSQLRNPQWGGIIGGRHILVRVRIHDQ